MIIYKYKRQLFLKKEKRQNKNITKSIPETAMRFIFYLPFYSFFFQHF